MVSSMHRSSKFYQSNRKKEALRMIVSIYNLYILYIDTIICKASFLRFD